MKLLRGDVQGLARRLFGDGICRHCVSMLRLAVERNKEYIVPRCGRCGLAVDSRKITKGERVCIVQSRLFSDTWYQNQKIIGLY